MLSKVTQLNACQAKSFRIVFLSSKALEDILPVMINRRSSGSFQFVQVQAPHSGIITCTETKLSEGERNSYRKGYRNYS